MNDIFAKSALPFGADDIDKSNYTASLLMNCASRMCVPAQTLDSVRIGLDAEFTEVACEYTRRESTSIPRETAEKIYSSVLYCTDAFFIELDNTEAAVKALCSLPVSAIAQRGREIILRWLNEALAIHKSVYKTRLKLPIFEYKFVTEKAFDEFFSRYSARFDAQSICTSIDYPLLHAPAFVSSLKGVRFIRAYYSALLLENIFCRLFPHSEVLASLERNAKRYDCEYGDLVLNISQVVLDDFLIASLADKRSGLSLRTGRREQDELFDRFSNSSDEEIAAEAIAALAEKSPLLGQKSLVVYLAGHAKDFARELRGRMKQT